MILTYFVWKFEKWHRILVGRNKRCCCRLSFDFLFPLWKMFESCVFASFIENCTSVWQGRWFNATGSMSLGIDSRLWGSKVAISRFCRDLSALSLNGEEAKWSFAVHLMVYVMCWILLVNKFTLKKHLRQCVLCDLMSEWDVLTLFFFLISKEFLLSMIFFFKCGFCSFFCAETHFFYTSSLDSISFGCFITAQYFVLG